MTRRTGRAHIDGIGGVFLYSQNASKLARWYREVMGIPLRPLGGGIYYREFTSRSLARPRRKVHSVFAIFPATRRLGRRRDQAMINYRVDDLEAYVRRLRRRRVAVDPIAAGPDGEGTGKFTHLTDPEGNRIELWEPSSGV
jgi:predicted enzyme related to lactoylglutathione lyase